MRPNMNPQRDRGARTPRPAKQLRALELEAAESRRDRTATRPSADAASREWQGIANVTESPRPSASWYSCASSVPEASRGYARDLFGFVGIRIPAVVIGSGLGGAARPPAASPPRGTGPF